MRQYFFRVEGLPPKKDGAKSMWGKSATERIRLLNLRRAAFQAFAGQQPLAVNISIALEVHVGLTNSRATGDLDNFITGICDGLMAADGTLIRDLQQRPESEIAQWWARPEQRYVHPNQCIAIVDDSQVISIQAIKIIGDASTPWYTVMIEGA